MANEETAKRIIEEVGGPSNIEHLTHCATRLRFTLKDATIINKGAVEKIPGVMAAIPQSDTAFQVVIGPAVEDMYNTIQDLLKNPGDLKAAAPASTKKGDGAIDQRSIEEIKAEHRQKAKGRKAVDAFFEYLSDSFRPVIGILLAASLVIAAINVFIAAGVIPSDTTNPTVLFFKAISQSVFYFLPVFIAYNACAKLKADPWLGVVAMMVLLTPQFLALGDPETYASVFTERFLDAEKQAVIDAQGAVSFDFLTKMGITDLTQVMGLPMMIVDYSGNVFVPLMMAPILAGIYKLCKKIIPSGLHLIFVPGIVIVSMTIITAFVLGPIAHVIGAAIGMFFNSLNTVAPLALVFAIPLAYPFLVPLGLHWPLNALMLANISTMGYDFIQGPMGIYDFACFGASFGVLLIAIRENDKGMKAIAGGAVAAGLMGGISEPSLYGIHLRYKKAYPIMIVGCVVGAAVIGTLGILFPSTVTDLPGGGTAVVQGVTTKAFAFTSLFTVPVFDRWWVYLISIGVAFFVPAILMQIFDYRTPEQKVESRAAAAAERLGIASVDDFIHMPREDRLQLIGLSSEEEAKTYTEDIKAPIDGETVLLSDVKDKAFSMKALGEGIVIRHNKGKAEILSPVDGVVRDIPGTAHAVTIMSDTGTGVLVHIGLDAADLNTRGFSAVVANNDKVKAGDVLIEVDFDKLREVNFNTDVIVTVINTSIMEEVKPVSAGEHVQAGGKIITVRG